MNDGGPAFPRPASREHGHLVDPQQGMSLRQWYVGQMIEGLVPGVPPDVDIGAIEDEWMHRVAAFAFRMADALVAYDARGGMPAQDDS